jgi:hypothetical protein
MMPAMNQPKREAILEALSARIAFERETLELWREFSITVQIGPQRVTRSLVEFQEERITYLESLLADFENEDA